MLEHLKLFDPRRVTDPRAVSMWWGVFFATAVWAPVVTALAFV
jgi:hypothetical protein